MIIPNLVGGNGKLTLAVPDPTYWCSTAAEYYINIPGYSADTACVWSDGSGPFGNWAPFVAGANQVSDGSTFVMVGINPIYCCQANSFPVNDPGFAIRIDCPGGNCNGMPCECNPSTMGPNKCTGGSVGAGGAEFCIVTVPSGGTANIVIFPTSNGSVVSTSAFSKPGSGSVVHVPAPAPAPSSPPQHEHPPSPPPPASSSADDCTTKTSTSSYWDTDHTASAVSPQSQPHHPYSSGVRQSQVYPSAKSSASASPPSYSATSPSYSSSSSSSPAAQSSLLVQVTSGSDRAMYTSTLLCLMCVVALGMVNL